MRHKRLMAGAVAVLTAGLLAGCVDDGQSNQSGANGPLETVRLALSQPPVNPIFTSISVAEELGYFAQEGIRVEYSVSTDPISAVAAGQADIAPAGPDQLLRLKKDNPTYPVKGFFQYMTYTNATTVVLPDSPIRKTADLRGHTVGVQNLSTNYATTKMAELDFLNIPENEVTWVSIPPGAAQANALKNHDVDAIALGDTNAIELMDTIGFDLRYVDPVPEFAHIPGSTWAGRDADFTGDSAKKYVAFIRAWTRGWAYLQANPRAALLLHIQHNPELIQPGESEDQTADRLLRQVQARNKIMQPLEGVADAQYGRLYPEPWKPVVDLIGGVKAEDVIDNVIVEQAYTNLDLDAVRAQATSTAS